MDSITIYLDKNVKGVLQFIKKHLPNRHPKILLNMRITIFDNSVRIEGSLAKYILGSNLDTPTYEQTIEALLNIGKILNVDIGNGIITRIDIANTFKLDHPVYLYLLNIWSCPHTCPSIFENENIQFRNSRITLSFYDKKEELEKKYGFEAIDNHNANLLRIELQLKKKVARKLNQQNIYVNMLFDKVFYVSLFKIWFNYFKKVKIICMDYELPNNWIHSTQLSPSEFVEKLAILGFQKLTSKEKRIIVHATKNNENKNSYYRILKKINRLTVTHAEKINSNDLWSELSKKVLRFYKKIKLLE